MVVLKRLCKLIALFVSHINIYVNIHSSGTCTRGLVSPSLRSHEASIHTCLHVLACLLMFKWLWLSICQLKGQFRNFILHITTYHFILKPQRYFLSPWARAGGDGKGRNAPCLWRRGEGYYIVWPQFCFEKLLSKHIGHMLDSVANNGWSNEITLENCENSYFHVYTSEIEPLTCTVCLFSKEFGNYHGSHHRTPRIQNFPTPSGPGVLH